MQKQMRKARKEKKAAMKKQKNGDAIPTPDESPLVTSTAPTTNVTTTGTTTETASEITAAPETAVE